MPCPNCHNNGGTWHHNNWTPCPTCHGIGDLLPGTLPTPADPADTFMERAERLRAACVDAAVDSCGRDLTPDEWEILTGFVGDAEQLWDEVERRGRMVRFLVTHLSGRLSDLAVLRLGIRRHMEAFDDEGGPEDLRLWALVDEDVVGPGDGDWVRDD